MCTNVYIFDDDECLDMCETVGELRAHCPVIIPEPCYGRWFTPDDADCLCTVDIKETAEANGMTCGLDDCGDMRLTKPCG